ncbi:MAG: hypothetical protein ACOX6P_01705 [Candidatus Merdivicinus sp.]
MNHKQQESLPFGTGISTMLMVFVILCLTVFGMLAFLTARADSRLTDRMADSVQEYYAADARAEELLAEVDGILLSEPDTAAWYASLEEIGFSIAETEKGTTAEIRIPIEGTRIYRMQLLLGEKSRYQVSIRRVEDEAVWEEEALDVWDGQ